jgi:endonuclease/exonuclease/phosphatase family metal-dependent hydrolase
VALPDPADGSPGTPAGVRVLMLSVFGDGAVWPDRRPVVVAGLRELRPDLVVFEEAIKTDAYDQVVDLLGPDYHVAHQAGRPENGSGLSIASRWPFVEVRQADLPATARVSPDFPCAALAAEIVAPDPVGAMLLVGMRTSWQVDFSVERELEAVAAARFVEETAAGRDLHVVLAGDMNADPDAATVRFWTGRTSLDGTSVCYRDAWESANPGEPGHTFTPRNPLVADWDWPFRRIDYVMVRCGEHGGPTLAVAACDRAFDRPVDGVWASDHFGVVADLAPPRRRA